MTRFAAYATAVAIAIGSLSTPSLAAPCKDAKGKFTKCPPAAAASAARCRKDGKFAKCGTPGAVAVKK